jgi:hypothetical protein
MTDLAELPATFTTAMASRAGVHSRRLADWKHDGEVMELSRGVYRRLDAPLPVHPDFLAVSYRSTIAVVCLGSAAAFWNLSDENPPVVSIAVPRGTRAPHIDYPPVQVSHFDRENFNLGVDLIEAAAGEDFRIYSAPRTVIDLFRLRHRMGEALAFAALKRYLLQRGSRPALLIELARTLGVTGPLYRALDVVGA